MKANVNEIAADVYRISTFHPEYGIQFNQFLIKDDEPFMPYTPYTDSTLQRLATLAPQTLALMHGSSYRGNGRQAILELAEVIREMLGTPDDGQSNTASSRL